MKYALDCKDSFENSFIFWLTRYVKFKLSSLSNKELRDPKALASVNFALSREIKNIDQLDGLVKSARNAGLTGINTYFNPLKKIFETLKFYELESLKQIDEELLSEVLASVTGGLSDASKKNYRISVINFFAFLDKQNEEEGKAHVFDIELKNWGGVGGARGQKLPEFMSEDEVKRFLEAIENAEFHRHPRERGAKSKAQRYRRRRRALRHKNPRQRQQIPRRHDQAPPHRSPPGRDRDKLYK